LLAEWLTPLHGGGQLSRARGTSTLTTTRHLEAEMLTPQVKALLDQMQTMIDQSHALQLEMLATWRIVL
jgi:hypothetical protein